MFPQLIISSARITLTIFAMCCVATTLAITLADQSNRILFSDEFNGDKDASFNAELWSYESGGGGWGNEELQYYTGDKGNVRLDGKGNLEIRALELPKTSDLKCWYGPCRYTSARLVTKGKFQFTYGRTEARIKLPEGAGVWPAFWMLGIEIDQAGWPSCGEIDIMEFIGREPSTIYGTLHGPGYSGASSIGKSIAVPGNRKAGDRFHTFAAEWEPNRIGWYLDGKLYHTMTPKDLPAGSRWVFDKPFFLILNFAVGGKWPGAPDASTKFPQTMLVDYVRVTSAEPKK
jgi:beta-glucanase (GH16 family)